MEDMKNMKNMKGMEGMKEKNKFAVWSYYIGAGIVLLTHLYILGFGLAADQVVSHSIINIIAVCLIAYGWFKS